MKRLLDFKLQADDVLRRQISAKADLLNLEDVPPRVCVNRLLQECTRKASGMLGTSLPTTEQLRAVGRCQLLSLAGDCLL
jgi:hypothetical protein